ncbi:MAG: hypothetical protein KGZ85_18555 [Ignavibacterium sp.]|nr:hypothetical protein [Ignavibacterium sp.]
MLLLVIVSSIYLFSQQDWINYNIEDYISINLPTEPIVFDTLGTTTISSETDSYIILITKMNNNSKVNAKISSEDELNKFYEGVVNGYLKSTKGELVDKNLSKIANLRSVSYSIRLTRGDENRLYFIHSIFIEDCMYTFQFLQLEIDDEELKETRDIFFNSINISKSLNLQDQFTAYEEVSSYKLGYFVGQIFFYLILISIPIIFIIRRKRKKHLTSGSS